METIITSLSILILDIILLTTLGLTNFRAYHKEKFNFFGNFPFEMHDKKAMPINNYVRSCILIFALSSIFLQIFLFSGVSIFSHSLTIIIGSLSAVSLVLVFFINLNNPKFHLLAVTLSITLNILSYAALIFMTIKTPLFIENKVILYIIAILLGLGELVLILNPKMTTCFKLENEENEDGTITYKRGKRNYLAFVEWFTFFSHLAFIILSLIFIIPTFYI